jgi:hypothetical protein
MAKNHEVDTDVRMVHALLALTEAVEDLRKTVHEGFENIRHSIDRKR